jgi:hypothetical protein
LAADRRYAVTEPSVNGRNAFPQSDRSGVPFLFDGQVQKLGQATAKNFVGPIQAIIPWLQPCVRRDTSWTATEKHSDTVTEIVRIAKETPRCESLPVVDEAGRLRGFIKQRARLGNRARHRCV